jgi:hypothetical protein
MLSFVIPNAVISETDNATGKAFDVGWGWYALAAGDIGVAISIVDQARRVLSELRQPVLGLASRLQVERAFKGAFQRIRRERAADEVLGRQCLTRREFRRMKGTKLHEKIAKRLDDYELTVSLLVFGGGPDRLDHLFAVEDPGLIYERRPLGYSAIGSGANAALAALANRWTERPTTYATLIYRLCAAKFSCESVQGVGQMTNVLFTAHHAGPLMELHPRYVDRLRLIWRRDPQSPMPVEAEKVVAQAVEDRLR